MFKIKFGCIWLGFVGLCIFILYGPLTAGGVNVDGMFLTKDELNSFLMLKIFFGVFLAVGIYILVSGIIDVLRDKKTDTLGKKTYGMIVDIYTNGAYENNKPEYDARVILINENNEIQEFTETVGFDGFKYSAGEIYEVKYLANDVNILSTTPVYLQDEALKQRLFTEYREKYIGNNSFTVNEITDDNH